VLVRRDTVERELDDELRVHLKHEAEINARWLVREARARHRPGGMISLVCSIAANNIGYSLAQQSGRDVEEVRREVKANLVPGAILVPFGIYALIRAQNAGCAYMQGT
jgi:hypothetical protein